MSVHEDRLPGARRLAILTAQIEASKPQVMSFEDFHTNNHALPDGTHWQTVRDMDTGLLKDVPHPQNGKKPWQGKAEEPKKLPGYEIGDKVVMTKSSAKTESVGDVAFITKMGADGAWIQYVGTSRTGYWLKDQFEHFYGIARDTIKKAAERDPGLNADYSEMGAYPPAPGDYPVRYGNNGYAGWWRYWNGSFWSRTFQWKDNESYKELMRQRRAFENLKVSSSTDPRKIRYALDVK